MASAMPMRARQRAIINAQSAIMRPPQPANSGRCCRSRAKGRRSGQEKTRPAWARGGSRRSCCDPFALRLRGRRDASIFRHPHYLGLDEASAMVGGITIHAARTFRSGTVSASSSSEAQPSRAKSDHTSGGMRLRYIQERTAGSVLPVRVATVSTAPALRTMAA